jgi:hypothetical protein
MFEYPLFQFLVEDEFIPQVFQMILRFCIPLHEIVEPLPDGYDPVVLHSLVRVVHQQRLVNRPEEHRLIEGGMIFNDRSEKLQPKIAEYFPSQETMVFSGFQASGLGDIMEQGGSFQELEIEPDTVPVEHLSKEQGRRGNHPAVLANMDGHARLIHDNQTFMPCGNAHGEA